MESAKGRDNTQRTTDQTTHTIIINENRPNKQLTICSMAKQPNGLKNVRKAVGTAPAPRTRRTRSERSVIVGLGKGLAPGTITQRAHLPT
eukprot:scaffold118_cov185-Amphora_coffeaeformis.AAC.15